MGYVFFFLLGFGLAVTGGVTTIAYLNFIPAGISWGNFFVFISGRPECWFLPIGFLMMAIVLFIYPNKT